MTTIDKALLQTLRVEMNAALKAVAEKHGVVIEVGNASFMETSATFKLGVAVVNEDDENSTVAEVKAAEVWTKAASSYGLKSEWLGETIAISGRAFKIVGLNTRKYKKPVIIKEIATGKNFVTQVESITLRLGK